MRLLRLYARVLSLLGSRARLAWTLAIANLALAAAQFAEPILFGRVVDALNPPTGQEATAWSNLVTLLLAWVAFGLFNILVSLFADRLSHSQRHVVLTHYYEHILQLTLSYHGGTHSGRLMKVMLQGTDSLWGLWLGFFRDHLAGFVSLLVLMPLSLFMNWRLASLLIVLCAVFSVLTLYVMRKTERLQGTVEGHYSELAERASDTLGNVALVHSFTRIETEVNDLKSVTDKLLAAQIPILSWWAVLSVLTRAATTITVLTIVMVGAWLHFQNLATVGEIVTFMSFATMLIDRLQHAVAFSNRLFMDAPRLAEFFDVMDTIPCMRDRPDAIDPGRVRGQVEFRGVSFAYDDRRPAVSDLSFLVVPGETLALVGPTGAGKSTALALLHRAFDPQAGAIEVDGMDIRTMKLAALRRNIGVVFQESLLFNRSIAENLRVGKPDATEDELRRACARAQVLDVVERQGLGAAVGEPMVLLVFCVPPLEPSLAQA